MIVRWEREGVTGSLIGMRVTETGELRALTDEDVRHFEEHYVHRKDARTVFRREDE